MPDDILADTIYEAAFNPDIWVPALDDIGRASSSAGGCIALMNGAEPIGVKNSEIIREVAHRNTLQPHPATLQRLGYLYVKASPGFVAASRFFPREMIEADPFYHDKTGLGLNDEALTLIALPGGETAMFSFDRPAENGPFSERDIETLDRLRPHLARAALVSGRLRLQHARAAVSALEALGIPAAVLSRSGQVRVGNALLDRVSDRLRPAAFGGVALDHAEANRLFQEAIAASLATYDGVVRSIAVPAGADKPALVVHVLPLKRSAYDIFGGADILVAATVVDKTQAVPSPTILTGLFDLAPAEARLASALATGRVLKEISAEHGITVKTARSYLEQIFRKTGTRQQSELVALLKSAGAIGAADCHTPS